MLKQKFIKVAVLVAAMVLGIQAGNFTYAQNGKKSASFKVRVENVSDKDGLAAQDGSKYPFALSPGIFVVSTAKTELFTDGKKASAALESQSEDGNPGLFAKMFPVVAGSLMSGVFNKPVGSDMASPIFPGGAFEFTFNASEGMKLNMAMMYGQSNDLFYAPAKSIKLFVGGKVVSGDITEKFLLWDAGTEVNQAPGLGADQGPRQKGPNTGADENGVVRLVKDGFTYPATKDVLRITITAM
jgi:hypothetical protein